MQIYLYSLCTFSSSLVHLFLLLSFSVFYLNRTNPPLSSLDETLYFKAWGLLSWVATKMQPRSMEEILIEVNLDQEEEQMGWRQGKNVPLLSLFLMDYSELKFLHLNLPGKFQTQSELWLLMSLCSSLLWPALQHIFICLSSFPWPPPGLVPPK